MTTRCSWCCSSSRGRHRAHPLYTMSVLLIGLWRKVTLFTKRRSAFERTRVVAIRRICAAVEVGHIVLCIPTSTVRETKISDLTTGCEARTRGAWNNGGAGALVGRIEALVRLSEGDRQTKREQGQKRKTSIEGGRGSHVGHGQHCAHRMVEEGERGGEERADRSRWQLVESSLNARLLVASQPFSASGPRGAFVSTT